MKSLLKIIVVASGIAVVSASVVVVLKQPSEADIKVTRDLIRAGQVLKIEVLDHIVMGNGNRSSLRELGHFYA